MYIKIKEIIKSSDTILKYLSYIYNMPFVIKNIKVLLKNNIRFNGAFLKNVKLNVKGNNNTIIILNQSRVRNTEINMWGNNGQIIIGSKCLLKNSNLWLEDNKSSITIGENTTFEQVHIAALENYRKVTIGTDCMFSRGIEIRTGDSHAIINSFTGEKINEAKDIMIGNHVWIGANATILKGVKIEDNSVIGIGSIVTANVRNNVIVAGVPAREIKQDINWSRFNMVKQIVD